MQAYIFLSGMIDDYSFLVPYIENNEFKTGKILVVCADGGYRHAKVLGVRPDVIIGDMDSVGNEDLSNIKAIKYPKNKDYTDGRLAVDYAISNSCDDITIFGALGGRFDHTWGNVFLLKYIAKNKGIGRIIDRYNAMYFVDGYMELRKEFRYVSVFPVGETASGVTLEGFKYPLDNATLIQEDGLAISNEIAGDTASVRVGKGNLFVICSDNIENY